MSNKYKTKNDNSSLVEGCHVNFKEKVVSVFPEDTPISKELLRLKNKKYLIQLNLFPIKETFKDA